MILRLDELAEDRPLEPEICIVGAGAAGLAIASELLGSGRSVLVVESGTDLPDTNVDDLNRGEVVGRFNGLEGRARGLGGTMQLWPGQSLALRPSDLAPRAWVPYSGWPISWDELARFYPRAWRFLGLPAGSGESDIHRMFGIQPPPIDGSRLSTVFSAFAPEPNRARPLRRRLASSRDVDVLLGATAVALERNEAGERVDAVRLRSLSGRRATVVPRTIVLCGGGIENPRLLLVSEIGSDAVGRYFQDHPWSRLASVRTSDPRPLQTAFGVLYRRGVKYHPKLVLTPATEEKEQVLGCSANFVFDVGEETGTAALLRYYRSLRAGRLPERPLHDAGLLFRDVPEVASAVARRYLRGWSPARRSVPIGLLLVSEQAPDPDNRIVLSEQRDALGVRRAKVEWRVREPEEKTLRVAARVVEEELSRTGIGTVVAEPADALDSFHHIGATRMSTDPQHGVVDRHCRVHGISNLFVAGSSVFPTSGFANPTLTIVALALRLADDLRR